MSPPTVVSLSSFTAASAGVMLPVLGLALVIAGAWLRLCRRRASS